MKYKISIIVPIYNVEKYIISCLQSVIAQTMNEGIECILVDDCGQDNSMELAESFVNEYTGNIRFVILHHNKNLGLSEARNTGMRAAQGDYIFFLDSDDEISKDCMEILYAHVLKHPSIDVVEGNSIKEVLNFLGFNGIYTENQCIIKSYLLTYHGKIICAQMRLIRRKFLEDYKLTFKKGIIHEDNMWTFFLAKIVKSIAFSFENVYYHRYNPNSITNNINIENECKAYRILIETFSKSIDPVLKGAQKKFILNNLLTAINSKYYKSESDKAYLIETFVKTNSSLERVILNCFFKCRSRFIKIKILHLLIRVYKYKDK